MSENANNADIREVADQLAIPAILIKKSNEATNSYFGGSPPRIEGVEWPRVEDRPLCFLACIDLAEVPNTLGWLPQSGTLLFFYDMLKQPWGFDPKDRGAWRVLYQSGSNSSEKHETQPAGVECDLPRCWIRYESASVPPVWTPERYGEISDEDHDSLELYLDSMHGKDPKHQIGGFPNAVQNDYMELECQLASNGLYCGNQSGYEDPRASALEAGAADWKLLLQIDTDDDLEVMWGDDGRLYFWVREDEAKQCDFSNAWVVLQCY